MVILILGYCLSFPCGICFEARFIPKKLIRKFADKTGRGYPCRNIHVGEKNFETDFKGD